MFEEIVKKGAAYLSSKTPGWRSQINLETLDVGTFDLCVIGQLYGATEARSLDDDFADSHGFNLAGRVSGPDRAEKWEKLQEAWVKEISESKP